MFKKNIFNLFLVTFSALFLSGCELFDEMFGFESRQDRQTNILATIKFENNESKKNLFISSKCSLNKPSYIYYETPKDAYENIFKDTKELISIPPKNLKPHWDIRYVNRVTQYKNNYVNFEKLTGLDFKEAELFVGTDASIEQYSASVAGVKCIEGKLAAGTTINLADAPQMYIDYGGPHSTFIYRVAQGLDIAKPWKEDKSGNLLLQANFTTPIYKNFSKNIGGGVNFGIFLRNKKKELSINYIIGIYAIEKGSMEEKNNPLFDPTTGIVHISTVIDKNSRWSTMSPKSQEITRVLSNITKLRDNINRWPSFYRVNITYNNLYSVLKELKTNPPAEVADKDFGLNPADWEVSSIYIQYELEEEGGDALLSGSFRGFEAYTSKLPL